MAAEKDRVTNAIMALVVGAVVLLSRDFIALMLDSGSTWMGGWVKGWGGPGGVLELLLRLVLLLVVGLIAGIGVVVFWVLSGLNQIYVLPILAMLISYATPWPFRLGFLNPRPYLVRGSQWVWDMVVLSTYGEYLRRGRGKNIVFILLPLAGIVAVAVGLAGLSGGATDGTHWRFPSVGLSSIMPAGRTLYVDRAVETHLKAGVRLQKVSLDPNQTKLQFRFWTTYPPWTKMSISTTAVLSAQSYLVDNSGNRYAVTGSEDMALGQRYNLVIREDRSGTLIFEPLRAGVKSFDLHFHSLETGQMWLADSVKVQ